jgi:hypothetical protein
VGNAQTCHICIESCGGWLPQGARFLESYAQNSQNLPFFFLGESPAYISLNRVGIFFACFLFNPKIKHFLNGFKSASAVIKCSKSEKCPFLRASKFLRVFGHFKCGPALLCGSKSACFLTLNQHGGKLFKHVFTKNCKGTINFTSYLRPNFFFPNEKPMW